MSPRARGADVRKVCECGCRRWPKCPHAWYFSFKPRGEPRYRFSLDEELGGRHVASKIDAENVAATIRAEILAGTFRRACGAVAHLTIGSPPSAVTLDQFAAAYLERGSRQTCRHNDRGMFNRLRAYVTPDGQRLGDRGMVAITEDTLEAFFASLSTCAASTRNKYVQLVKASFRWACRKGYIARSRISEESALKRTKVAQRRRRVSVEEEKKLIDAASELTRGAGLRLPWLIVAAIEVGARVGELLALAWGDVDLQKHTLLIRAVEVGARKTVRSRLLPVSARLQAVLEMARFDPAGREYGPTAYVFGVLGRRVRSVRKTWETCVLRAHGHEPRWKRGGLAPESREALRRINLTFHDLRHEAGCRWLEAGWPLHHIQEMLGHANVSQTSTYLHATEVGLQESMRRFDLGSRGKAVAKTVEIEQPPVSHDGEGTDDNKLLH